MVNKGFGQELTSGTLGNDAPPSDITRVLRLHAGNIIQEAPLQLWASFRQRALDTAIAEITKKTDLKIQSSRLSDQNIGG
jgi:hypothetical protein